jgi:hypothetical protein
MYVYVLNLTTKYYCRDLVMCDYRRGMDWWLDLPTTCIHHLELQVITALSLISETKFRSLSPQANYTDRVIAACRRS